MINMAITNSPLVSYTKLSPNHSGKRTHAIDRISPHCVVGQCSVETLGNIFAPTSKEASCNYGIGVDGRIGMYVEECNRSWCTSSNANDQRAVTIECASDNTAPYAFKDVVYQALIDLCVDICKRNGKTKLLWLGDKAQTLAYEPQADEMVLTVHRWFANKSCPGDWMYARMGDLAAKVTAALGEEETPAEPVKPSTGEIRAGDTVRLAAGATYYNGDAIPSWVIAKEWIVREVSGDRAVIDASADGKNHICSPVNVKFLCAAGGAPAQADTTPIKAGDTVSIADDATYYGGGAVPDWVRKKQWIVLEVDGDRAVIDKSVDGANAICSPINTKYLHRVGAVCPYLVKVTVDALNIRSAPGAGSPITGCIRGGGVFTIVAESAGWGKLKSGAGWISLDYTAKV